MTCRIEPAILQINFSKCTQRLYGDIGRSVGLNETNEANEETEESEAIEALLTNTFRPLSRSIVFSKINTSPSNWDSSPRRRILALHRPGGGGGRHPPIHITFNHMTYASFLSLFVIFYFTCILNAVPAVTCVITGRLNSKSYLLFPCLLYFRPRTSWSSAGYWRDTSVTGAVA